MIAVMAFQCTSVSWSCRLRKSKSQRKELAELSVAGRHASVWGGVFQGLRIFCSLRTYLRWQSQSIINSIVSKQLLSVGHFWLFD